MNIVNLTELSPKSLAGFTDATTLINEANEQKHNSEQDAKPENERVAFVPETVQSYADRMAQDLGIRYYNQMVERRKQLNQPVLEDAIKYLTEEQQDELKAQIRAAKAAAGE